MRLNARVGAFEFTEKEVRLAVVNTGGALPTLLHVRDRHALAAVGGIVTDRAYASLQGRDPELDHAYGENVHILADPFLLTHLAFLCAETTTQPAINHVVRDLYRYLIKAVMNGEFPRVVTSTRTRICERSTRGSRTRTRRSCSTSTRASA